MHDPMTPWATRALRVALLTGGLLAVGTGVAAASDHSSPDLDVTVPVTVTGNALGVLGDAPAPGGLHLPAVTADLTVDAGPVAVSVPVTVAGNAATLAGVGVHQPAPVPAPAPAPDPAPSEPVDVAVPVTVSGTAVGVLGDAEATGAAPAAPAAAVSVPVTVCGNGVGVLGSAAGACVPPAGPTGPQQPTDPEQPAGPVQHGTPQHGTQVQHGTPQHGDGFPADRLGPVTAAAASSAASAAWTSAAWASADGGADRAASAVRRLADPGGAAGTEGSGLAATGADTRTVLGVAVLSLLLGTGLALASRRPGRTR